MKYTEDELMTWSAPLSQTEEARAENAIKMIKIAIAADDELKSMDVEVFTQGSFSIPLQTRLDAIMCSHAVSQASFTLTFYSRLLPMSIFL